MHRLRIAACLAACALASAAAWGAEGRSPVGTVSLVIGDARVTRSDGSQAVLRQGSEVVVGDRVETGANGHVHLRFVDRGAVSVRPGSVLEVQSYRYDRERPETNEVRLKVEHGTARSISGAATEADKSRFRLNTPIAAIGVRGTDFIVQSTPQEVRAVVAQGAITVAPLGNGCSAAALGPCSGAAARELSAEMGRLMVEVRSGERVAQIAPAVAALLPALHVADSAAVTERSGPEAVARFAALAAAQPSLDPRLRTNDRAAADVLSIAPITKFEGGEPNRRQDADAQLAWGRWSFSRADYDKVSLEYKEASQGRHVTVGDADGGLWRRGGTGLISDQVFAPPEAGRVDLRLTRGSAGFEVGGRVEAASVDGGTLQLDFGQRTFATALALSSASAGRVELRAGGLVDANGVFNSGNAEQRVSGAISFDGKEAGYLFERITSGGVFRGRTLWGK